MGSTCTTVVALRSRRASVSLTRRRAGHVSNDGFSGGYALHESEVATQAMFGPCRDGAADCQHTVCQVVCARSRACVARAVREAVFLLIQRAGGGAPGGAQHTCSSGLGSLIYVRSLKTLCDRACSWKVFHNLEGIS